MTLGRIAEAERFGAESVSHADRSGDAFLRMASRATHADALHHCGEIERATALFAEAEGLQAEWQPSLPRLYSLVGYTYCDLLLTQVEAKQIVERAQYMLDAAAMAQEASLLDFALCHLALGRAHAALAQQTASPRLQGEETHAALATRYLDDAVARLIEANSENHIPRGFLARAAHRGWLFATTGDPTHLAGAQEDLADAEEIARRDEPNGGAMRLYLTDIALERCQLSLAELPPELTAAPVAVAAVQAESAGGPHESDPDPQPSAPADDWQEGIVDLRRETAAARPDGSPPGVTHAEPPGPLRRWDMWAWLEQEKARAAAAPEQQAAAPAGEPQSAATSPALASGSPAATSAPEAPLLTPEHLELIRQAEAHWQDAAKLIEDTGYHRRDGERDALRRMLDRLASL